MTQTSTKKTLTSATSGGGNKKKQPAKIIGIENYQAVYPPLWSSVWVVGPERKMGFASMLGRAQCRRAESLEEADIVIFTGGGADVDPLLYGETRYHTTHTNEDLMREYIEVFNYCLHNGVAMVGICLGAQFLHVMNGGKLYQDVDKHDEDHHLWIVSEQYMMLNTPSIHHQLCYPNDEMIVTATADHSTRRVEPQGTIETRVMSNRSNDEDIEAFMYPETGCLGFQGHPEYPGYPEYTVWVLSEIEHMILNNPDFETNSEGRLRLKQNIREQRFYKRPASVVEYEKEKM